MNTENSLHHQRTFRCKFSCCRDGDTHDHFHGLVIDDDMIESFLNHPPLHLMHNPITMHNIQTYQTNNAALMQLAQQDNQRYPVMQIDGRNIICYRANHINKQWLCGTTLFLDIEEPLHFTIRFQDDSILLVWRDGLKLYDVRFVNSTSLRTHNTDTCLKDTLIWFRGIPLQSISSDLGKSR